MTDPHQRIQLTEKYPYLKNKLWLINSDAHRLDMINEPIYEISEEEFYGLWRKRYG